MASRQTALSQVLCVGYDNCAHSGNKLARPRGTGGQRREETPMADEKTYKFVCTVCGFEVEVDTPELPEDYTCPMCGVGADMFELVEE